MRGAALKDALRRLLEAGDEAGMAAIVAGEPKAVRHLVARLWDKDEQVRARAVRGLGEAAARHPWVGLETVRRLRWALNDESATNGGPALAGLGEIGRRAPQIVAPHVPALVALVTDEGLRKEVLHALAAVASAAPELIEPHRAALECIADLRPDEAAALEALRKILEGSLV
jgi:HEAT repeat protein